VTGEFLDEVAYGLLADEWRAAQEEGPSLPDQ
jgi:hypothetical protein